MPERAGGADAAAPGMLPGTFGYLEEGKPRGSSQVGQLAMKSAPKPSEHLRSTALALPVQISSSLTVQQESAPYGDRALPDIDRCPSCSSPSGIVLFSAGDRLRGRPGTFEVLQCVDCGLARIRPAPTQHPATLNLERIRDDDPSSIVRRLINSGRRLAARRMATVIRGRAHGGAVLDLGGGSPLRSALHRHGLAAVAATPTARPVSSRFSSAGDSLVQNWMPDDYFSRGAYDVIVGKHVLEHEPDPRAVVHAMLEMLAPHGWLVIQVPNANSWQALLLAGAWEGFDIPRHPVCFDDASLEQLLDSCGLVVASRRTGSIIEAALCLATSLCPWLDPDLRQVRGVQENRFVEGLKDLSYCLVAIAVFPLILLELASDSGPAILVEARRRIDDVPEPDRQGGDDGATTPAAETAAPPEERAP